MKIWVFVFTLAKKLRIKDKVFLKSMKSFLGLPHRYEIFQKSKNVTFINDSKATSFQAAKFALASCKNIYWILGGLPKDKDKFRLKILKEILSNLISLEKILIFLNLILKKTRLNILYLKI